MPHLSISSWSLHRALGPRYGPAEDGSNRLVPDRDARGELSLLEVPGRIAEKGIQTLEICHFHYPSLDAGYIDELRAELKEAGVDLFSVLIDAGDLTHPDRAARARDLARGKRNTTT